MQLVRALEILHIDAGLVDDSVQELVDGLAPYIQQLCGLNEEEQAADETCRILEKFLLLQWYYGSDPKVDRIVDSLSEKLIWKYGLRRQD